MRLSGSAEVADLVDAALEVSRKQGNDPRLGPFDRSEIKVNAPQYADLILQALGEIRKLEIARAQLRLAEKKLDEEGDGNNNDVVGFEIVAYEDETPV